MKQNRYLPFGYRILKGRLTVHENEAEAVKQIYEDYLSGMSYQSIAEKMSASGIAYKSDSPLWNKHMVKRVLENSRYTGQKGFPNIIEDSSFQVAAEIIQQKNQGQPLSKELDVIRKKLYCFHCGSKYERDGRNTKYESWCCKTEGRKGWRISDQVLLDSICAAMNTVIAQPELLGRVERHLCELSLDVTKLNNQINRELEKAEVDSDYVKLLILNCAAEKYASCKDCETAYLTEQLKERYRSHPLLTEFDPVFFDETIKHVLMDQDGTVHLEMMNQQLIHPETMERSKQLC